MFPSRLVLPVLLLATSVSQVGLACARGERIGIDGGARCSPKTHRRTLRYGSATPRGGRGRRTASCPPLPGGKDGEAAEVLWGNAAGAIPGPVQLETQAASPPPGSRLELTPGPQERKQDNMQQVPSPLPPSPPLALDLFCTQPLGKEWKRQDEQHNRTGAEGQACASRAYSPATLQARSVAPPVLMWSPPLGLRPGAPRDSVSLGMLRVRGTHASRLKDTTLAGSHPFQRNRRRLWLQAIKRVWDESSVKKDVRVCSAHFISGDVSLDSSSPDFVPSLFVYAKPTHNVKAKMERYRKKMRRDDLPQQPAPSSAELDGTIDHSLEEEPEPEAELELEEDQQQGPNSTNLA